MRQGQHARYASSQEHARERHTTNDDQHAYAKTHTHIHKLSLTQTHVDTNTPSTEESLLIDHRRIRERKREELLRCATVARPAHGVL